MYVASIYTLATRFDTAVLVQRTAQIDPGFDPTVGLTTARSVHTH